MLIKKMIIVAVILLDLIGVFGLTKNARKVKHFDRADRVALEVLVLNVIAILI